MDNIHVFIEDCCLGVEWGKQKKFFTTDDHGIKEVAQLLVHNADKTVLYSSSVDFPEEEGAPDKDYRREISKAIIDLYIEILGGKEGLLKETIKTVQTMIQKFHKYAEQHGNSQTIQERACKMSYEMSQLIFQKAFQQYEEKPE